MVNVFFIPPFLIFLSIIIFLGLAAALINSYLRLAQLRTEVQSRTLEFRAVTQNLGDGVIIYNLDFKILNINQAAEEILELKAEEIVGKYVSPDLIKNPRLRVLTQIIFPSLAPTATQVSSEEWPQVVDLELEDPPLKLRTTLNRITDKKGRAKGFLKLVRDQTRERGIVQSKSEFITIVAHQLRTPLTAIRWSFENLSKSLSEKPEFKEIISNGLSLSQRMLKIVNDLLDAAKIEEGKFGYKFQDIELTEFINQILSRAKPIADEYGIKISFKAPSKKYKVRIDPERLGIAFSNILDNAIRYNTKDGSVIIQLEEVRDKEFIKINITDTGVGIPPKELGQLFKKFYRGSNATKIEPNGSGLGLYITKNIMKRHGGDISVESNLGRGSRFWFTLPLDPSLVPQKEIVYEESS